MRAGDIANAFFTDGDYVTDAFTSAAALVSARLAPLPRPVASCSFLDRGHVSSDTRQRPVTRDNRRASRRSRVFVILRVIPSIGVPSTRGIPSTGPAPRLRSRDDTRRWKRSAPRNNSRRSPAAISRVIIIAVALRDAVIVSCTINIEYVAIALPAEIVIVVVVVLCEADVSRRYKSRAPGSRGSRFALLPSRRNDFLRANYVVGNKKN